ncbi:MAG: ATP synthase F1 subunit epsilon [Polyangiaceae bacterium]|nr:ATP synthase F1 subunit epsilon [Polyangiaceae bacterium]
MSKQQHIALEIVTPDGVRLREEVESLAAPSVDGEFGVLPGHRPLLAALKTGIVSYAKDGAEVRVAVGPGFVEVHEDRAVLLTDRFTTRSNVDPVRSRLALKEADAALDAYVGDPGTPEHAALVCAELWAAVELELYGDPPPPTYRTYHEFAAVSRDDYAKAAKAAARQSDGGSGLEPR